MPALSKRLLTIAGFIFVITILSLLAHRNISQDTLKQIPHAVSQKVGLGEWSNTHLRPWLGTPNPEAAVPNDPDAPNIPRPKFIPGQTKPVGYTYRKMLIVARIKKENIEWMDQEIPEIEKTVYVADDPDAPFHPPLNKGHEVMIYLTYIIDHYDDLPDVMIFMHSHQRTWHNNDVFGGDAAEMIRRLSPERVTREGYMNMRCQWYPGCPDWMHPGETEPDRYKTEQTLMANAWAEIFPFDPVPDVLAQACCAQFALSRDRVRGIPRAHFVYYRDWLLRTPLKDFVSGRVWEYLWQYIFTGKSYWCPAEHACYCDGYGACFGGKEQYDAWFAIRHERDRWNGEWLKWDRLGKAIEKAVEEGKLDEAAALEKPEPGKDDEYRRRITELDTEMNRLTAIALDRGRDPRVRAEESGRDWQEGDGF